MNFTVSNVDAGAWATLEARTKGLETVSAGQQHNIPSAMLTVNSLKPSTLAASLSASWSPGVERAGGFGMGAAAILRGPAIGSDKLRLARGL
jgi:hypothetical protein